MKIEKRSVFGWPSSGAGHAAPKNGIAIHYDGSNQGLAKKSHSACRTYWARTRKFHMGPSRRWADVGYSFAVCPHGIVLEGRGLNKVQAAQPGGNATWYSVTFMSGPSESPTAAQINAFRELRAWLRGKGVKAALKPHSAFISTSCCGDILRRLISNGTLASTKPFEEELDMDAQDVFKAVWERDSIPAPPGGPSGPNWKGASFLTNTYRDMAKASEVKALRTEVSELKSELAEIKELLSAALPPKE
ncbi:peptidoglycan recognition protein family protein [Actinomadura alba]|uniref:N-acetylmuramoyl-L-alanine amidase n=1 Tax=Actinomadura alba TaxID=406431 RepID=A0ABR7M0H1_9ACTN|nr:peptidoglycan recognition family protein [Actinomadura alba]MBC6470587.1 N-acetylmuramoyl-L-alanine amidase [Actinomadura alba]